MYNMYEEYIYETQSTAVTPEYKYNLENKKYETLLENSENELKTKTRKNKKIYSVQYQPPRNEKEQHLREGKHKKTPTPAQLKKKRFTLEIKRRINKVVIAT